jgi:RHS repeat-associated protein
VSQRFEYDAAGRLKKVMDDSSNVIETYTYAATRERLIKETSAGRTYYVWGGESVIAEYTETGSGTTPTFAKSYVYAGSRLLAVSYNGGFMEFHHPDRIGTQLVTFGGTIGTIRQSTYPFGTLEQGPYSNQIFTSYDRSTSTGLDYAVNRTYSSGQSRFTQVDPIGMAAASIGNPQSNNLYAYVQNMPTDFVDPSGLCLPGQMPTWERLCVREEGGTWDCEWVQGCRWPATRDGGNGGGGGGDTGGGGGRGGGRFQPSHEPPRPLRTVNWIKDYCATTASALEHGRRFRNWRGPDGQFYKGPFSLRRAGSLASKGFFGATLMVSGAQVYNGEISPEKGAMDITMGYVGAFGGPKGAVAAGVYFGYNAFPSNPHGPQGNPYPQKTNTCHGGR